MSHVRMRHVTHMSGSWHTYECILSHILNQSCYVCMNEPCHRNEWVMSHIRVSHVTHVRGSWHKYKSTHVSESCHAYEWVMSHVWRSSVPFMNDSPRTLLSLGEKSRKKNRLASHMRVGRVIHMNETCYAGPMRKAPPSGWIKWHVQLTHVIYVLYICYIHVIYMLYMFTLYICYIYVIYICCMYILYMSTMPDSHGKHGQTQQPPPVSFCNILQNTATHCNTLQYMNESCLTEQTWTNTKPQPSNTATYCNATPHTATHWKTLQRMNESNLTKHVQYESHHLTILQHTATHCNTLQHTATHCNTLQQMNGTCLAGHTWTNTQATTFCTITVDCEFKHTHTHTDTHVYVSGGVCIYTPV